MIRPLGLRALEVEKTVKEVIFNVVVDWLRYSVDLVFAYVHSP